MEATTNDMRDKADQDQEGVCVMRKTKLRTTTDMRICNNQQITRMMTMTRDDIKDERQ